MSKNPEILHLSLRLQGMSRTGSRSILPSNQDLGIAIYFIFGKPGNLPAAREYGTAFLLTREQYEELMRTGETLIHTDNHPNFSQEEFLMSKKNHLDPKEVERVINAYLQALRLVHGEQVADMTDLCYRKGEFHLRPAGLSREALATPYRANQIEAMTAALRLQIPPRADSEDDGAPD